MKYLGVKKTMMVRAAISQDAPVISAVAQQVFAETYGSNLTQAVLQKHLEHALSPEIFAQEITQQEATFFVTENLAGFIKLQATPTPKEIGRNSLEVVKLYVDSSQHGSGVGSALMRAGLEWAKTQGYAAVWLLVWQENPQAVRFYQKHGFAVTGSQEVWVDTVVFQDHLMQKELR